jgi:hypothetical protein
MGSTGVLVLGGSSLEYTPDKKSRVSRVLNQTREAPKGPTKNKQQQQQQQENKCSSNARPTVTTRLAGAAASSTDFGNVRLEA